MLVLDPAYITILTPRNNDNYYIKLALVLFMERLYFLFFVLELTWFIFRKFELKFGTYNHIVARGLYSRLQPIKVGFFIQTKK